jgi:hypothetical protein
MLSSIILFALDNYIYMFLTSIPVKIHVPDL